MKPYSNINVHLLLAAILITALGSAFTYIVHSPQIGIDDANITQTYASNLAKGYGFVYNANGERVEGSTSLLWTIINTIFFFFSDSPETIITVLCFFLTTLIIKEVLSFTTTFTKHTPSSKIIVIFLIALFFISTPSFFGWSVWSLMDLTLWTFFYTLITFKILFLIFHSNHSDSNPTLRKNLFLYILLIFMPLVRPEGYAISIGFNIFLLIFSLINNIKNLQRQISIVLTLTMLMIICVTIFRIQYFGFAFPNTFYAKVSLSYFDQTKLGIIYILGYFLQPFSILIFLLSLIGVLSIKNNTQTISNNKIFFYLFFSSSIFGIFFIYVILGGDHFGSFRQYQVLTPILISFATIALANIALPILSNIRKYNPKTTWLFSVNFLIIGICVFSIPSIAKYYKTGGNISHEFRIAENDRELGLLLNYLPNQPSIAVLTAGGISRTYDGYIFDMMGLNWVEMAHANRKHNKGALKNHAAFDKETLLINLPDIILPLQGKCKVYQPSDWLKTTLDGLFADDKFKSQYREACFNGARFYVSNKYYKTWAPALSTPN